MLYRAYWWCGNKYLMYDTQILADNKVCSCLCVSLWGNFICRMHLQACITFFKVNLSNYFLIIVSWHIYTYPTACQQLVCESFVYFRCTYWHLLYNLRDNVAYMSFLSQTDCCSHYLLLAVVGSQNISSTLNFDTSLHILNRNSSITACLMALVVLAKSISWFTVYYC